MKYLVNKKSKYYEKRYAVRAYDLNLSLIGEYDLHYWARNGKYVTMSAYSVQIEKIIDCLMNADTVELMRGECIVTAKGMQHIGNDCRLGDGLIIFSMMCDEVRI